MALDIGDENINSVEVWENSLFVSIIVRIPSWKLKNKITSITIEGDIILNECPLI